MTGLSQVYNHIILLIILLHTQTPSRCRIQLKLETSLGKALIEEISFLLASVGEYYYQFKPLFSPVNQPLISR